VGQGGTKKGDFKDTILEFFCFVDNFF